MLRFGVQGRFVICGNLEKCLDATGNVRDTCSIALRSRVKQKHASTSRLNCLIDSAVPSATANAIQTQSCQLSSSTSGVNEVRKTCLYDLHVEKQGKVVNFAGWLLPVQYREAIAASHQHTRSYASLFDVGHMMQTHIIGKDAGEYLESLTTCDLKNLKNGAATLTVFTNDMGGILDDLIVTKDDEDKYFVVSNAARRNEDSQLLLERQEDFKRTGKNVRIDFLDPLQQGLVALQGPTAAAALQSLVKIDLQTLKFMNSVKTEVAGSQVRISRCGYTGEDGFEISVLAKDAVNLVERILEISHVKLAGLGARDSLRLEAGLCLYGNDMNADTTPVEAALTWLIAKRRRVEANFPGAQRILSQIKTGAAEKRVGLLLGQGPPARQGAPILTPEGERVGKVTSGGPSPTLGRPIAMGYVPSDLAQFGGGVLIEVRGKTYKATVTKMPFVKTNYYTAK
ncbi:aminomethyltransferase, mitochondrial [Harpegnathos saltator]|uniref:Aminomethyltransferase n=1 Tax=Harpegnathos saltator TaxID=610380 RepID=E2BQ75_HARSA|nr:aminomethyltransferase, mitochondrial [Harpegnathos saltator]EFN82129.1 Aminomethyltransferase, mitochondrial [Harpegnathos saltator]